MARYQAVMRAGEAEVATGAEKAGTGVKRSGLEPLWEDPYFFVWDNPSSEFVSIHMRHHWRKQQPEGMGIIRVTKQVTPRHFDEKRSEPTRSVLLLRAWALWRAHQAGWANKQRGRSRHFADQAALLERDIKALGAPCGFLGHKKADNMLQSWVPDIVERLRA